MTLPLVVDPMPVEHVLKVPTTTPESSDDDGARPELVTSIEEDNFRKETIDEASESGESESDERVCIKALCANAVNERQKSAREDNTSHASKTTVKAKVEEKAVEKPKRNSEKQAA